MNDTLSFYCPYCYNPISIDISNTAWEAQISEFLVTPLVSKVGHYHDDQINKWVEVASYGKGLKSILLALWNRSVGILRYPGKGIRILS